MSHPPTTGRRRRKGREQSKCCRRRQSYVSLGVGLLAIVLLAACGGEAQVASIANALSASTSDGAEDPAAADPSPPKPDAKKPERNFPPVDYLQQIPAAYRFASRYPEVLARIPCYCPCELYGHGGLIDCYRSQHAAQCQTCLEEAILAGQRYEAARANGVVDDAAVAAEVKNRYRSLVVRNATREMPDADTAGGRSFLQVCSDCHQPPHPAMYTPDKWRPGLSRMEAYAKQREMEADPERWQAALGYIRSVSGRFPSEAGDQYREQLAAVVKRLQAEEGDSAYYPGAQDEVLDAQWFDRMVEAYRLAGDLPIELLSEAATTDPNCGTAGHDTVLACLNAGHAMTSEATVSQIEGLARAAD